MRQEINSQCSGHRTRSGVLGGCNTLERLSQVGEDPKLTRVQNPTHRAGYRPVSMPMPAPVRYERAPNSLWRAGSRAFFKDLRASQVGDILTVTVSITDTVDLDNKIERTRTNSEGATLPNFLGYEQALNAIFPETVTPATLVNGTSNSSILGDGKIDRTDKVNTKVAAIVVQVLPNGNLVIEGRQEQKHASTPRSANSRLPALCGRRTSRRATRSTTNKSPKRAWHTAGGVS